jgi:hypothetical protein
VAIGIAILFCLFIGHTLVAAAGVWSGLAARQWGVLAASLAAGVVFDLQALPPWPPRISLLAVGVALAACIGGIVSVRMAARRAPNAEVEREIAARSSVLIGLASIEAVVFVGIVFGSVFAEMGG